MARKPAVPQTFEGSGMHAGQACIQLGEAVSVIIGRLGVLRTVASLIRKDGDMPEHLRTLADDIDEAVDAISAALGSNG